MFEGTSLIPNKGNQTQNIPPITSVNDKRVSSAAGIAFEPIEYKIKPKHTKVPCTAKRPWFKLVEVKLVWELIITNVDTIAQKNPAKETVVNLGVSFLHLKVTENTEKPIDDVIPKRKPNREFFSVFPSAIIIIPTVAIIIDTQTFIEIRSFKNKKANIAVKNGIAARHNKVIAALVFVIE